MKWTSVLIVFALGYYLNNYLKRQYDPKAVEKSPLLAAMKDLSDKETEASRKKVFEELLNATLIMPTPADNKNSVYVSWSGEIILFTDEDAKKRWCGDCAGLPVKPQELFSRINGMTPSMFDISTTRGASINPSGPGYLELNVSEMNALAAGDIKGW